MRDILAHTPAVVGVHLNVAADPLWEDPAEAAAALRPAQDVRNRAMKDLNALITLLWEVPAFLWEVPGVRPVAVASFTATGTSCVREMAERPVICPLAAKTHVRTVAVPPPVIPRDSYLILN